MTRGDLWKARIIYGVALLCSIALTGLYDNQKVTFTLLYALLLLLAGSLLTILTARFCLRVEEHLDRDFVEKNEPVVYTATIVNRGILPCPWIQCTWHSTEEIEYAAEHTTLAVGPRKRSVSRYTLQVPWRGVYRVGMKSACITDFLGLFRIRLHVPDNLSLLVYPQASQDYELPLRNESQSVIAAQAVYDEDYASVADVRKYTSADSYRRIHWKLSAKRFEWMVKTFQPNLPQRTVLFLDTMSPDLPLAERKSLEDHMVSVVTGTIDNCIQRHIAVELVYGEAPEDRVDPGPYEAPESYYRQLAGIEFQPDAEHTEVLRELAASFQNPVNMAVFLAQMDEVRLEALKDIIAFGHQVFVCFFTRKEHPPDGVEKQLLEELRAYGAVMELVESGAQPQTRQESQ